MTLRLQFDDIMNRVAEVASIVGGEEEFIETVTQVINISDKGNLLEVERKTLEKIADKKEKQLARQRAEFKRLSAELEREKKKIEAAKKEKRAMEKTLEDVRRAVLRNDGNTTSAEILSLIESVSFSDASEEWETAMNE